MIASTALCTDHYELTMVQAAMASDTANRRCVFELFPRRLPEGRRYGVVAGSAARLDAIEAFRFDDAALDFLTGQPDHHRRACHYLANYRFAGSIRGYAEGEICFPVRPSWWCRVHLPRLACWRRCCSASTTTTPPWRPRLARDSDGWAATLHRDGHPTNQRVGGRGGRPRCLHRRLQLHVQSGGGTQHGVPTAGTAAHGFTLLHDSEEEAFQAQLAAQGASTTLLVDTYDIEQAVRTGVRLTDGKLGAVRLDSGDLAELAADVRQLLDSLGATQTRIIVTSDLDEWADRSAARGLRWTASGSAPSLVTGSVIPPVASPTNWLPEPSRMTRRLPATGGEAEQAEADWRRQVRAASAKRPGRR